MGPTNVALVKLYEADQLVREAQARLEAATKDVRVQERRVNDLAEQQELTALLEAERGKLTAMKQKIGDRIGKLQAEIDALLPDRQAAAAAVPEKARDMFERLGERLDGEALSAIAKPDRRREE